MVRGSRGSAVRNQTLIVLPVCAASQAAEKVRGLGWFHVFVLTGFPRWASFAFLLMGMKEREVGVTIFCRVINIR